MVWLDRLVCDMMEEAVEHNDHCMYVTCPAGHGRWFSLILFPPPSSRLSAPTTLPMRLAPQTQAITVTIMPRLFPSHCLDCISAVEIIYTRSDNSCGMRQLSSHVQVKVGGRRGNEWPRYTLSCSVSFYLHVPLFVLHARAQACGQRLSTHIPLPVGLPCCTL